MRSIRLTVLGLLATSSTVIALASTAGAASGTQSRGQTLVANAIAATKAATSVTIHGQSSSSTEKVVIDLTTGVQDAYGTLTYAGQPTTIRRVGTSIYVKSSKGYLENQGASSSEAAVEANKWFKIPSSETSNYQSLMQFLQLSKVITGLVPSSSKGTVSSIKTITFAGQKAYVVAGTFDGEKGSFTMAAHGKPYLLRIVDQQSSGGGTVTLSNYNKPVHTSTPKGAVTQ